MNKNIKFIFFGTSMFSVYVLNTLRDSGYKPLTIVTFPDRPKGRKLIPTPNVVKTWAEVNGVSIIETLTLKDQSIQQKLKDVSAELFIVASFGRILPSEVIYMPLHKTLNVHPSLLPRFRGPAPIQEAILTGEETGVSIMRLDEGMDTGPILAQEKAVIPGWPTYYKEAEEILGKLGGKLLVDILPDWISGNIQEVPQNSEGATKTRMIARMDGDITNDPPEIALRKIKAFEVWPRTFMFYTKKDGSKELLIVRKAEVNDGVLIPLRVIPAGRNEMAYEDFLRGR
jgi:methionyl-tRNA formyltransferase